MAISTVARSGLSTFDKFQRASAGNTPATGNFIMGGSQSSASAFASSADGITWTLRSATGFGACRGLWKIGSAWYSMNNTGTAASSLDPIGGTSTAGGNRSAQQDTNGSINGGGYVNNGWAWWGTYGFHWNGHAFGDGTAYNYTSMAYGNGVWVIVYGGNIYYATATAEKYPAGLTYSSATSAVSSPQRVFFDNGLFVATGSNGLATSTNGISWTQRSSAGDFRGSRVIYAGGLWFAGISGGTFYTSPDAITWTSRSSLGGVPLIGAAFGVGTWTVVNQSGTIWSSTDGTTWTTRTNPVSGTNYSQDSGWYGFSIMQFG